MMKSIILDRKTGHAQDIADNLYSIGNSKIVILNTARNDILSTSQKGDQLIVKLKSGQSVVINDFFHSNNNDNRLVIDDQSTDTTGYWWLEHPAHDLNWVQLDDLEPLMLTSDSEGHSPLVYLAGAGLLAAGGVALGSGGGGGGGHHRNDSTLTPPLISTNNSSGITGTGIPGMEIVLTKPDDTTERTTVGTDGKWAFNQQGNPLNHGETGKFVTRDPNNINKVSQEVTSTADTQAPNAPTVNKNNATELSGTAEPNSKITLTKPDGTKVTTDTDTNGNWKFAPNPLEHNTQGPVTATDAAGNTSINANTGLADKEAPNAPTVNKNNATELSGTAEPNSKITLTKPDGTKVTTDTDTNGNWKFAPNPLEHNTQGPVTATDAAGNTSINANTGLADKEAPNAPTVNKNNATELSGTAEPNSKITLTKPDGTKVTTDTDTNGNWKFAPNPLDHNTQGSVTATDAAGNTSNNAGTGIADKEAPNAPIVESNNAAGLSGTAEPNSEIILTKPDNTTVSVKTDQNGHWKFAPNPLDHNTQGIVTATDAAGNTSINADTGIADKLPPRLPTINTANIAGVTGVGEPGTTVKLKGSRSNIEQEVRVDNNGKWALSQNPFDDGEYISASAVDQAGNVTIPSPNDSNGIFNDVTAPNAPRIETDTDQTLIIASIPGEKIVLKDSNGNIIGEKQTNDRGKAIFEPNPFNYSGSSTGTIVAVDAAGNESEAVSYPTNNSNQQYSSAISQTIESDTADNIINENEHIKDKSDSNVDMLDANNTALANHHEVKDQSMSIDDSDPKTEESVEDPQPIDTNASNIAVDNDQAMTDVENNKITTTEQALEQTDADMMTNNTTVPIDKPATNAVVNEPVIDNIHEGTAADDIFNLIDGTQQTLIYKLLDAVDATGGNGHDVVNNFTIGDATINKDADIINLKELLNFKGTVSFYNDDGELKLDDSSKEILDYIRVDHEGNDTIISIDRDGLADGYEFTKILTLKDTDTDLLTLLSNHQIIF